MLTAAPKIAHSKELLTGMTIGLGEVVSPCEISRLPFDLKGDFAPFDDGESWAIENSVMKAFESSGYPLGSVRCHVQRGRVTLSGHVFRYFHLQVAIEATKRVCDHYRIESQIAVFPPKTTRFTSDAFIGDDEAVSAPHRTPEQPCRSFTEGVVP